MRIPSILLLLLVVFSARAYAEEGREQCSWSGIAFPHCTASFADEVISVTLDGQRVMGDHSAVLGKPDNRRLRLGCEGTVIVRFLDNVLVDVPDYDLHIFERGEDKEPTHLWISDDISRDDNWIDIGEISGATASIDIGPFVGKEQTFTHVRLTDLGQACDGDYPGAEIDAIGAIGAAIREQLDSNVLFDYDSDTLRPEGETLLASFAQSFESKRISRLIINGHTSSEGTEAYNQTLSRRRADAVHAFLGARPEFNNLEILSNGLGESQSDQQVVRENDRRVDIWMVRSN